MAEGSIFRQTNPEIYVVTTAFARQQAGQVATWVTLATLVPDAARVVVILSPHTHTSALLQKSQGFVLNLLSDTQSDWLERFGMWSGHDRNKFEGIECTYTDGDLPILPGTCGWAECQVSHQLDVGDRIIWVADVTSQSVNPGLQPLRRVAGLAALPDEVRARLVEQRLADIERDRPYRFTT